MKEEEGLCRCNCFGCPGIKNEEGVRVGEGGNVHHPHVKAFHLHGSKKKKMRKKERGGEAQA